jgi:hypothetical protein
MLYVICAVALVQVQALENRSGDCLEKQGCQMVYLQTKNPNFGEFWSVLQWKM